MKISHILFLHLLLFNLYVVSAAAAPEKQGLLQAGSMIVYSITPAQAEPGAQVFITADGINDETRIFLGGEEVIPVQRDKHKIAFMVPPDFAPGQYVLSIRGNNRTQRSYTFRIQALKPVIFKVDPNRIFGCRLDDQQEAIIHGRNLTESSQLLFDGSIIPSRYIASNSIGFSIPKAAGGMHQISVKNGQETTTPLAFTIVMTPIVSSISIGQDRVNSYDLIIEGQNFQQNSVIFADGVRVDSSSITSSGHLSSIDCTRIIYQRKPFSPDIRNLRIQVVNPNGESSQTVTLLAP